MNTINKNFQFSLDKLNRDHKEKFEFFEKVVNLHWPKLYSLIVRTKNDPVRYLGISETIFRRLQKPSSQLPKWEVILETYKIFYQQRPLNFSELKKQELLARKLAFKFHANQKYGIYPYSFHLEKSIEAFERFKPENLSPSDSLKIRTVIWLHDTVEDTSLSLADIYYFFGKKIGDAVHSVTNIPKLYPGFKEPHQLNKQRKVSTKKKTAQNYLGRMAKIFDRIANTEESLKNLKNGLPNKYKKYTLEWDDFFEYLYRPEEAEAAWSYLNRVTNSPSKLFYKDQT